MILDGHIHTRWDQGEPVRRDRAGFWQKLQVAGVGGGVLISLPPATFDAEGPQSAAERLDDLFYWCEAGPNLYPFYWIDPLEEDAIDQVAMAIDQGVTGFKVICDRYDPGHERAMEVADKERPRAIAQTRRPILFHSGILWDGKPSAQHNRPGGFEALLEGENLKRFLGLSSTTNSDAAHARQVPRPAE